MRGEYKVPGGKLVAVDLDVSDGPTARFVKYRSEELPALHSRTSLLLPIGHYEADRRREKLLEDIEGFLKQAAEVELQAWRDKIVKTLRGASADFPMVIGTGESARYLLIMYCPHNAC